MQDGDILCQPAQDTSMADDGCFRQSAYGHWVHAVRLQREGLQVSAFELGTVHGRLDVPHQEGVVVRVSSSGCSRPRSPSHLRCCRRHWCRHRRRVHRLVECLGRCLPAPVPRGWRFVVPVGRLLSLAVDAGVEGLLLGRRYASVVVSASVVVVLLGVLVLVRAERGL